MSKRRVVVTGMGMISPFGVGVDRAWDAIKSGQSGITQITKFDTDGFACKIAGQVPDASIDGGFDANDFIEKRDQKKMDTFIQFGVAASVEAVKQAGLDALDVDSDQKLLERIGVYLGSGIGGLPEIEKTVTTLNERGPRRVSPFYIPSILINMISGHVSMKFGFKGPNNATVTACATASHAIGCAKQAIELGNADVIVAGGSEACICPTSVAGFAAAKALSTGYNDTPEKACRPFDKNRDGFVMAEGAGVLVLEEYEHAKKRGATILAELSGFGQTGDAYHMTTPAADGNGGRRAIEMALEDAQIQASEIGYVNAHATSTPAGDEIESRTIQSVFGDDILVSATKSMTGHALGAAGGWEAIFTVKSLEEGVVPPTINLDEASDSCTLDYVSGEVRRVVSLNAALSNSFGFGGTNASLIFKKVSS